MLAGNIYSLRGLVPIRLLPLASRRNFRLPRLVRLPSRNVPRTQRTFQQEFRSIQGVFRGHARKYPRCFGGVFSGTIRTFRRVFRERSRNFQRTFRAKGTGKEGRKQERKVEAMLFTRKPIENMTKQWVSGVTKQIHEGTVFQYL